LIWCSMLALDFGVFLAALAADDGLRAVLRDRRSGWRTAPLLVGTAAPFV
jgi:hypothetical protein